MLTYAVAELQHEDEGKQVEASAYDKSKKASVG